MAEWIKSNGEVVDVQPKNGTDFSVGELQGFVGGHFELLRIVNFRYMVVNEDGKIYDLPFNQKATDIYRFENIVGNVLVCDVDEIK